MDLRIQYLEISDYSRVTFINLMKFVDFNACNHGTMNQFHTLRHMSYRAYSLKQVRYVKRNDVNFRGWVTNTVDTKHNKIINAYKNKYFCEFWGRIYKIAKSNY
jgi:hypothetical protein